MEPRARRAEGGGRGEVSRVGDRGWSQSAGGIRCGGGAEAPDEKEPRRGHGGSGGGGGGDGDTRGRSVSRGARTDLVVASWAVCKMAHGAFRLVGAPILAFCEEERLRHKTPEPNPGETLARSVVPLRRGAVRHPRRTMAGYRSRSPRRSYSPRRRYSRSPPRRKRYDGPRDRYRWAGAGGGGDRRGYGRPSAQSGLLIRNISLTAR